MFVSGLNLQERPGAKKRYESGNHWAEYSAYLQRTSILLPCPPALYVRFPNWLKRTLFLEFPIYVFDPERHADGRGKGRDGDEEREGGREGDREGDREGGRGRDVEGEGEREGQRDGEREREE